MKNRAVQRFEPRILPVKTNLIYKNKKYKEKEDGWFQMAANYLKSLFFTYMYFIKVANAPWGVFNKI